jgi:ketosteroid isomerase-like protein
MSADVEAVADGLHAAFLSGDPAAISSCFADDAVIWHNFDDRELTLAQNLAFIGPLVASARSVDLEVVRRHPTEDGYVEQHVMKVERADGTRVAIPTCHVMSLRPDGAIVRMEEYIDLGALQSLRADTDQEAT